MANVHERLANAMAGIPWVELPAVWAGGSRLGIPGVTAMPMDEPWDTIASAQAPDLSGDHVRFAVTADGRTLPGGNESAEALQPLAKAVAARLDPPFWAVAVPESGGQWSAAGISAEIVELPGGTGDEIEASRVGGEVTGRVDGDDADVPPEIAELLVRQEGDTAILAHRFAGPAWVVEVFPL